MSECKKCKGTGRIDSGLYDHRNGSSFYDCDCTHKQQEKVMQQFENGEIVEVDAKQKLNDEPFWDNAKYVAFDEDSDCHVVWYRKELRSFGFDDNIRPVQFICDEAMEDSLCNMKSAYEQSQFEKEEVERKLSNAHALCHALYQAHVKELKEKDAEIERLQRNQKNWSIESIDHNCPIIMNPEVGRLVDELLEIDCVDNVKVSSIHNQAFDTSFAKENRQLRAKLKRVEKKMKSILDHVAQ